MHLFRPLLAAAALLLPLAGYAEDYVITLENKVFTPAVLEIPADTKVKVTVKNRDNAPAEFESSDLGREKVIEANGEVTIFIGPLAAGKYTYFNEFNSATTGTVVVK